MVASGRQGVRARVARTLRTTGSEAFAAWDRDPESELWSTFGYETICLFWNLPLKAFRALSEAERQRLVRVSNRIDALSATEKDPLLREIGHASPMKRLATFRRLARVLAAGGPIVTKPRPGARPPRSSIAR